MADRPERWGPGRLGGVRARTTLAVVAVTGVAAALGAWALVLVLGASLTGGLAESAETRAADVAAQLEDGTAPADLVLPEEDDRYVHVLDSEGQVVAAGPDAPAGPAVVPDGDTRTDVMSTDDGEEERLVVTAARPADSDLVVVVSQEASEVDDATSALGTVLWVAVPVVVLAVGLTTWWLVGRSLAPVEAIRAEVETITADRLARRVPEPAARDEVGALARTMNQMLDRLESAQARQRQLVSDASHELRSPATAIRQHAEVTLAHPGSSSAEELARVTLAEGRRLEQLVEQMLWLARSDEATSTLRTRAVDLDDLVLEEVARVRTTGEVAVDASAVSGGQVDGDPLMLRRVVANLLDNAVGHAASRVDVGLREHDGAVLLRVDDDGPGIAPDQRERVLGRFVRLDEARSRERGGAGLGLAIVLGVVETHGGRVVVDESGSGGARFEVVLPARGDAAHRDG